MTTEGEQARRRRLARRLTESPLLATLEIAQIVDAAGKTRCHAEISGTAADAGCRGGCGRVTVAFNKVQGNVHWQHSVPPEN